MTYCVRLAAVIGMLIFSDRCLAADRRDDAVSLNAVAAVTLPDDPLRFAMLEARVGASPHAAFAAAMAYLDRPGDYHELQLRLTATLSFDAGAWTIENRNMLLFSSEAFDRYRSRVRFIRPGLLGAQHLSLRAFDELFVDIDDGRLLRNTVALGFGAQIRPGWTVELYHVWTDNRAVADDTYVLALLSLRL